MSKGGLKTIAGEENEDKFGYVFAVSGPGMLFYYYLSWLLPVFLLISLLLTSHLFLELGRSTISLKVWMRQMPMLHICCLSTHLNHHILTFELPLLSTE